MRSGSVFSRTVCVFVRESVCNALTVESLDIESLFSTCWYIFEIS